ncbi:dGTPase [Pseudoalteromonas ruthenica]|uniref:dGTPase n=1 Tax=Pseudoalteromonas ruthenica TaxID=151081 RepID=UPI00110BE328|nr:dGTPase [Pseudoalteromonas ruthenica]TMO90383.1 dGTPase [Pseudoalteromonas ruthenica]TMP23546.1 dGTPase [Pseudoalteromonas ruthenica]
MAHIDFTTKINTARQVNPLKTLHTSLESDRGRIINSSGIRRLQQKTQVFPLERNAAVRSRLTHSLEVQQNGRFIVQKLFSKLNAQERAHYGLTDMERPFETLVEMACLMHDIGNPAFGHFGEAAINHWFSRYLQQRFGPLPTLAQTHSLKHELLLDLQSFEGNAQAIRAVHSLLALNLSYSQIAAILKYTRPGTMAKNARPEDKSYLMKKVGFYHSEAAFIAQLGDALEMDNGCRHPASYIMEAADDIAYCLADMEDAVEKGILSVEKLVHYLDDAYRQRLGALDTAEQSYSELVAKACEFARQKADEAEFNYNNTFFIYLRVKLLHPLVEHAATRFKDNIEQVYAGTLNASLIEDGSHHQAITDALKTVARERVFCHPEVEKLELQGYKIISGLLDEYQVLLDLEYEQFTQVLSHHKDFLIATRMVKKLSGKYLNVYEKAVAALDKDAGHFHLYEFYHRCRLIQDHISGMTDQFAYDEYRTLKVVD